MKDEDTTRSPDKGTRWTHNDTKNEYGVTGARKAKFDSNWHDGVDYEDGDGKYWRTLKDFYKNFTAIP